MSPTATVAAALVAWAQGLGLSVAPTVSSEPPQPGTAPPLPTLAIWFPTIDTNTLTPPKVVSSTGGRGVYQVGDCSAEVMFRFRLASYADADDVRDEFWDRWLLSAMASDRHGMPVLHLPVTLRGVAGKVKLAEVGQGQIYQPQPSDTLVRNLWQVDFRGAASWPRYIQEASPGTGLMDVAFRINGGVKVDLNTATATPTMGG